MNRLLLTAATCVFALPLAGCVVMSSKDEIVGADEPRVPISFESDVGFVTFHDAVRRYDTRSNRDLGESNVVIPLILASSTDKKLSYNAYYNRQIEMADVDQDGVLSDLEVRAYAGRLGEIDTLEASASEQ
ncbi:MAG: hypothetical protein AAGK78_16585 [Planctomycetota bacterium]